MNAYRMPDAPAATRVHSWTTVHGRCPSCGSHPDRSAHMAQAQTAERVLVTCGARADDNGCGAQWVAESYSLHRVPFFDEYGAPIAWLVLFAIGVGVGVGATLIAGHP